LADLDADLEAIFDGDDLDQIDATFAATGGDVTTKGFFTLPTEATNLLNGDLEANDPTFMCRTAAVAAVRNEDAATIDGDAYTVKRKQNLGAGMSLIYLKT
jgi:hypothetical protein